MAVININNYAIIEGDSGSQYIEFVVYADAAVTADTYFYYYTQDGTASSANGDFFQTNGTGFIRAGASDAKYWQPGSFQFPEPRLVSDDHVVTAICP